MAFTISSPLPTSWRCKSGEPVYFEFQDILDGEPVELVGRSYFFGAMTSTEQGVEDGEVAEIVQTPNGDFARWRLPGTFSDNLYYNYAGSVAIQMGELLDEGIDDLITGTFTIERSLPLKLRPDNNAAPLSRTIVRITRSGTTANYGQYTWTVKALPYLSAPATLNTLTLSNGSTTTSAANGSVVGTILGKVAGSTLTLTDSAGGRFALNGRDITVAGTLTQGSFTLVVRETLANATNSPRESTVTITVVEQSADASPFDFSSGDSMLAFAAI